MTDPVVLEVRRVVEGARGAAAVQVGVVGAVHHLGAAHRHPARRRARPMAAPAGNIYVNCVSNTTFYVLTLLSLTERSERQMLRSLHTSFASSTVINPDIQAL